MLTSLPEPSLCRVTQETLGKEGFAESQTKNSRQRDFFAKSPTKNSPQIKSTRQFFFKKTLS
jgi:hypothetical protein